MCPEYGNLALKVRTIMNFTSQSVMRQQHGQHAASSKGWLLRLLYHLWLWPRNKWMSKLAMCTHLTRSFAPKTLDRDTMLAAHLGLAPIREWRSDAQRRCPKKNWHMLSLEDRRVKVAELCTWMYMVLYCASFCLPASAQTHVENDVTVIQCKIAL